MIYLHRCYGANSEMYGKERKILSLLLWFVSVCFVRKIYIAVT